MDHLLILSEDKKCTDNIAKHLEGSQFDREFILFDDGWKALTYIIDRKDIYGILVDLDSPYCDDLRLIKILKTLNSNIEIIFMSTDGRYAIEAFSFNVAGYLIKPIEEDKLIEAISKMKDRWLQNKKSEIFIRTFGTFEIVIKGRPLHWRNSKTKELLSFLVDSRGNSVSSEKIQKTLWPDMENASATFHTTLHHLRQLLKRNKIEFILECSRGSQRVNAELFKCDFYEFEKEVEIATRQSYQNAFELYKGHYLENNAYSWSHFNKVRLEMLFEKICQAKDLT